MTQYLLGINLELDNNDKLKPISKEIINQIFQIAHYFVCENGIKRFG